MAELQVLSGDPDAAELAALVTVLAAVARPRERKPRAGRGAWSDRAAGAFGRPGAWRRSGLPG